MGHNLKTSMAHTGEPHVIKAAKGHSLPAQWLGHTSRRLKEFAGLGNATYLGPRWIVLRAVGIICVFVFAGIISEGQQLIGPRGLVPLRGFFDELAKTHPGTIEAVLRAPSLFWLSDTPAAIATLAWGGLAAAIALILNFWPRMMLFVCWSFFLSFVTTWRGFSATQVDQLMLETALLCIPFAPAGLRPGLGAASPPRPIAVFAVRWLLFRVMFESGLMKLFAGDPHWLNFTALDVLYETSPFPTLLGYFDHQLPHSYHVFEVVLTYAAEIAAPLLAVFAGRPGRWFAFAIWTLFQIGIQLTNNFGWLNAASIGLGFLLLDDQMLRVTTEKFGLQRVSRFIVRPVLERPATSGPRFSHYGLRAALGLHFCLTLYFLGLNCGLPVVGFPYAMARPLKFLFWDFRSANAYTLYAGLLPARIEVEFEGSNDGGATWRSYDFRYQPQHADQISPFIAPKYARFEATLQVEANRQSPSPLFGLVAAQLLSRNQQVLSFFRRDPFPDRPPTMLRTPVYQLKFTDFATHRKTGHFWHKELSGFYQPTMYLHEQGRIVEATSEWDELRLKAGHGNPEAQLNLGLSYAKGLGAPKDDIKAAEWYRKAADQGNATAQYYLGISYTRGDGVPKDSAEAAKWFRLAAEQGLPNAQGRLGSLYLDGVGVTKDSVEAAKWIRRAAEQGNAYAQLNLGLMYAKGEGVRKDEVEALAWFTVAALSGDLDAKRNQSIAENRVGSAGALAAEQRSHAIRAEIEARKTAK